MTSLDPVAIDQACVDKIYNSDDPGKETMIKEIEEKTGYDILGIQEEISEGECISGKGNAKYIALMAKTY